MSATTIDPLVLNSLFDNQKRLDDVFNSIFDDDTCFVSSVYSSPSESHGSTYYTSRSFAPKPSPVRNSLLTIREQHPYIFLLPILLEIAAIYLVVTNFL